MDSDESQRSIDELESCRILHHLPDANTFNSSNIICAIGDSGRTFTYEKRRIGPPERLAWFLIEIKNSNYLRETNTPKWK